MMVNLVFLDVFKLFVEFLDDLEFFLDDEGQACATRPQATCAYKVNCNDDFDGADVMQEFVVLPGTSRPAGAHIPAVTLVLLAIRL